jgi:hypothetical protein
MTTGPFTPVMDQAVAAVRRSAAKCCEELSRDSDFSHLEGDIAAVAGDLHADLDQLLPQAGQRPVLDRFGCCEGAQEVAEIVGESMKLKSDSVGRERSA